MRTGGLAAAVLGGASLALATGIMLSVPVVIAAKPPSGDELGDAANALVQLATALGFLLVPFAIAARRGASVREAASRLGLRRFRPSALKWMAAAIGAYLLFAIVYSTIIGQPKQKDVAEAFGAIPIQVLLIVSRRRSARRSASAACSSAACASACRASPPP